MATRTNHRQGTVEHPILEQWPPQVASERRPPLRRPRRGIVIGVIVGMVVALVAGTVVFLTLRPSGEVELTQGQVVDGLRLQTRAERELLEQQLQQGYEADAARWIAQAEFYEQVRQARSNAAWTARLEGQARDHRLSQLTRGQRADALRLEGLAGNR
jgi:hypothetical protein